jgi:hypothetical protein
MAPLCWSAGLAATRLRRSLAEFARERRRPPRRPRTTPPHDSAARSLASASGPRAPSPRHGAHDVATNGLPIISGALPHEESPRLELHVRPFVDHGLQRAWRSRGGDHGVAITGWRSRGGGDGGWWRRRELRGNERGRMDQRRKRPTSWICPPLPATHHPPPRHPPPRHPPPDDLSPRRRIVCLSPPPPQPTRHRPPASPSPPTRLAYGRRGPAGFGASRAAQSSVAPSAVTRGRRDSSSHVVTLGARR